MLEMSRCEDDFKRDMDLVDPKNWCNLTYYIKPVEFLTVSQTLYLLYDVCFVCVGGIVTNACTKLLCAGIVMDLPAALPVPSAVF
ncbi:UNVERIFIED_CONTAM: hypothetical protein FKN15_002500 [Acipenser sinensis]